jgi:hypothetical protein
LVGSRRNAAEIAGSITSDVVSESNFTFLGGCDKSSVAGLFLEISSSSIIIPFA